jgi:hypothetical protein
MKKLSILTVAFLSIFSHSSHALSGSTFTSGSTAYVVNTFTSAGSTENWTVPYGVSSIDAIAVGGGGGGGTDGGNGGGGGELRVLTSQSVTAGSVLAVTVASGGTGASHTPGIASTAGGNSTVTQSGTTFLRANGGQAGSGWSSSQNYAAGGTGGTGGTGSNGATGGVNRYLQNEGIGGAGSAGPTTTIPTGSSVNYGGGGGGGSCWNSINSGTVSGALGGAGGGGQGAGHTYGSGSPGGAAGAANTGGGGGGGAACDGGNQNGVNQRTSGGAGGSGVVVIRYILTAPSGLDLDTASDSGSSSTDNLTNDTTPTISGTAIGGSSVQLYVNGVSSGSSCTANTSTGLWSCTASTLSDGSKSIVARATISGAIKDSSTLSITIDATAPTINRTSTVSVAENSTSSQTLSTNESATISFSGVYDRAQFTFDSGSGLLSFAAHDYENPLDEDLNNVYYFGMTATDLAGNRTGSYNFFYTVTNVVESAILGSLNFSSQAKKGIVTTISFTSDVNGKVTYFSNGKRIGNCVSKPTTGSAPSYLSECSWKPSSTVRSTIYAVLTPLSAQQGGGTTQSVVVTPLPRGTTR